MVRRDVGRDQPDRGGEHRGIIGEAEHRQHVRDEIERQDEIGDGAEQRRLDMARRLLVERAIIGRQQILGERQPGHHPLQLDPEAPAHAFAVFRQPVGRLETHGMFGCHHLGPLPARPSAATNALKLGMWRWHRKI